MFWLKVQEVNCGPWSVWISAPCGCSTAMPRAVLTIAEVARRSTDQPTIRREHASSTAQQEALPSVAWIRSIVAMGLFIVMLEVLRVVRLGCPSRATFAGGC